MPHQDRRLPLSRLMAIGAMTLTLSACANHDPGPGHTGAWHSGGGPNWPPSPALYAHRGASAQFPEHTLAAYQRAIDDGADLIEPDLVITRDGVLVSRHENAIAILNDDGSLGEATSNVADKPEFAHRRTTKTIDGQRITGWFVEDFTLAELKTLRARERIPAIRPASAQHDDQFDIPTLQEVIDLARRESQRLGRIIGVAPETKHPSYFQSIGLPLEPALLDLLTLNRLDHAGAPVVIQSFEVANLKALRAQTPVRLAQLVAPGGRPYDFILQGASEQRGYAELITPAGLAEVKGYADLIAPHKTQVIPVVDGLLGTPTELVRHAHAAGLGVVIWTLRPENAFLPDNMKADPASDAAQRGDGAAEITAYLASGVDGIFSDDSAVGRTAIDAYLQAR